MGLSPRRVLAHPMAHVVLLRVPVRFEVLLRLGQELLRIEGVDPRVCGPGRRLLLLRPCRGHWVVLRIVQNAVSRAWEYLIAGSDRIVEARLEEAPVGVADVLAVIRDVDDPVLADLAWTRSPAPDLAVVRLALELSTHYIGRLVVVLELGELRPQLLLLLQRPLGAAGAPDGARRQRVAVLCPR